LRRGLQTGTVDGLHSVSISTIPIYTYSKRKRNTRSSLLISSSKPANQPPRKVGSIDQEVDDADSIKESIEEVKVTRHPSNPDDPTFIMQLHVNSNPSINNLI